MGSDTQKILKDNNIFATKPPGSTSHVTQPADVGKIFKSIKGVIPTLQDKDHFRQSQDNTDTTYGHLRQSQDNTDNDLKEAITSAILNHEKNVGKKFKSSH